MHLAHATAVPPVGKTDRATRRDARGRRHPGSSGHVARLYRNEPEPSVEAEALRLQAQRWHRRFLAYAVLFVALAGLSVLVDRI